MNAPKILNAECICRICLQEKGELFLIFDQVHAKDGATIDKILTECTRYKVERHDELPHQICAECMEAAYSAYNFKRKTERAYRELVDVLGKLPHAKEEIDFSIENLNEKSTQTDKFSIHPCEICGEKFFDVYDLREHRLEQHRNSPKNCRICDKTFLHIRQLKSHLALEHPNEGLTYDIQCHICQRQFSRKDHMKRHLRNVHKHNVKVGSIKEELEKDLKYNTSDESINNRSTHWIECEANDGDTCFSAAVDELKNADSSRNENPITSDDEDMRLEAAYFKTHFYSLGVEPEMQIKVEHTQDVKFNTNNRNTTSNSQKDMKLEPFIKEDCDRNNISDANIEDNVDNIFDMDDNGHDNNENINKEAHFETKTEEYTKTNSTPGRKRTKIFREYLDKSKKNARRTYRKSVINIEVRENNRCSVCQHTFSRHCHLRRHMLTHLNERPHICTFCSKTFTRSDHLKNHITSVHNQKQFKCQQCNCEFARNDALLRHKEAKHGDDPNAHKIYDCEYCHKKFTSKTYLRKHCLMHTDRIFACKYCEETFKDRKLFREHERTHSADQRNYLCALCGESFVRNDYLVVHMRRHTGEKPYKCQYCGKGFPRATDVKMHERYHTNNKPNICDLCGKGFHRAYNLTIHMRTHTGERPFKCDQCPRSFAQSNDLKAHIRRHTGERFRCTECDASFLQLYGLRQHALSAHDIHMESTTGRLKKYPLLIAQTTALHQQQQQQQVEQQPALHNFITANTINDINTNSNSLAAHVGMLSPPRQSEQQIEVLNIPSSQVLAVEIPEV